MTIERHGVRKWATLAGEGFTLATPIPVVLDRRSVLRRGAGAVGAATLAGVAGCVFGKDGDGGDGGGSDFLGVLPDPTPAIVPSFHAAYSYEPATVRTELDGTDAIPDLADQLVGVIGQLPGTAVDDVDRLSGQTMQQLGRSGGDLTIVTPSGTDLVAEGSIDVDGAADWFSAEGSFSNLGENRGYRRFGREQSAVDSFAFDGDAIAYGNREATEQSPGDITTAAIDGLEDGTVPAESISPELVAVLDSVSGRNVTVGTTFDLVAERPDTGTESYDATAASLVAAAVDADVGSEETEIVRELRYRRGRRASVDDVQAAVEAATGEGHFHDGDWTVSGSDRTVRISGTVSTTALRADPAALRRAVPVPAYDDLVVPVDPSELGRDAPPRVSWQPALLDDGRVAIVHGRGQSVTDIEVAYTADGERTYESWEDPVEPEDRFETTTAPDGGTVLDVVWARGTVNETILIRIRIPENDG